MEKKNFNSSKREVLNFFLFLWSFRIQISNLDPKHWSDVYYRQGTSVDVDLLTEQKERRLQSILIAPLLFRNGTTSVDQLTEMEERRL